ncbi:MAG TPA: SUF system NifU family Fe-S cluster assembly protein [Candidatus Acidoferrales bacterium]|jgi:nitrogen fixation NifU-like protein|nr:SUF system NifU family Fe-S cluster assembly protein [Candidatus Acidoferrales bacterium]
MADVRELRDLYQEVILEHSKKPRNYGVLESANHKAEGYNPLCGDHYTIFVTVKDGAISEIAFQGAGCAISKASASMMTQALKGKSTADAEALFTRFHDLVTGHGVAPDSLGKLAVFAGVSEYPLRVKCATLAWHAMRAALRGEQQAVSTE